MVTILMGSTAATIPERSGSLEVIDRLRSGRDVADTE
jgi:hypothetical protein